jgi:hypothetical protein
MQAVAPADFQVSVELSPLATVVGETPRVNDVATGVAGTATDTATD